MAKTSRYSREALAVHARDDRSPFGDLLAGASEAARQGRPVAGRGHLAVLAIGSIALVAVIVVQLAGRPLQAAHCPAKPGRVRRHLLAVDRQERRRRLLVLLGLVMALPGIPGQGLLTMIVGITMIDFPGKRGSSAG